MGHEQWPGSGWGLVAMEGPWRDVLVAAEQCSPSAAEALADLQEVLDLQVAVPLAHAMRMAASYFNDLSTHWWHR